MEQTARQSPVTSAIRPGQEPLPDEARPRARVVYLGTGGMLADTRLAAFLREQWFPATAVEAQTVAILDLDPAVDLVDGPPQAASTTAAPTTTTRTRIPPLRRRVRGWAQVPITFDQGRAHPLAIKDRRAGPIPAPRSRPTMRRRPRRGGAKPSPHKLQR
jgi:hypothetical protein